MNNKSEVGFSAYVCNMAATFSVSFAPVDTLSRVAYPNGWSYLGEHFIVFFLIINAAVAISAFSKPLRKLYQTSIGRIVTILIADVVSSVYLLFVVRQHGEQVTLWYKTSIAEYFIRRLVAVLIVGLVMHWWKRTRAQRQQTA